MAHINSLKPAMVTGPGDIIRRYLEARGWTQEDLAEITDLSQKTINQIINHKQGISIETARLLSRAFENSPAFWLNLDNQYRLALSDEETNVDSARIKARIRTYMPVGEIQKNGWVEVREKTAGGYLATYQEIWGTDTSPDFSEYSEDNKYCARQKREDETYTRHYSLTWYRIALNRAGKIKAGPYDPKKLRLIMDSFSSYTRDADGVEKLIKDISEAGVKFLHQNHLSKTYLDGACFFDKENPVIVYTARYNRLDNFWFTMAHEIVHILYHFNEDRELFFLDNLEDQPLMEREKEADRIASKMVKTEEVIERGLPHSRYLTERHLLEISRETGLGPSVVLGILQHHHIVDYRTRLNKYKGPVKELLDIPEV